MKTGITASSYFPYYGEERGLARIREDGFDAIDYGLANYAHPFYAMTEEEAENAVRHLADAVSAAGLTVSQTHGPWRWPPRDASEAERAETLERARKALRFTRALGASYMVIHPLMPFGDSADPDPALTHRINRDFFEKLLPAAAEAGVVICLENVPMPALSLASAASVKSFAEEMDSPFLRVCLDTGHALVTGEDPKDCVRLLGPLLACVHIHDNHGQRDEHLRPGDGSIDWNAFAESLKETGFDGVFSLETGVTGKFRSEADRMAAEKALFSCAEAIARKIG